MKIHTLPPEMQCDHTTRVYTKRDMKGNILCHFERRPHPDDTHSENGSNTRQVAYYYGQWIDMTEQVVPTDTIVQDSCNSPQSKILIPTQGVDRQQNSRELSNNSNYDNSNSISLPMRARAVEPDQVALFIERHKGQLEIITASDTEDS